MIATIALLLGAIADHLFAEPFFLSLETATTFIGWSPATVFLFLYGVPYAFSVAIVATCIAAIMGR